MPRRILVAVAWPYVNGEPHLGHIAGMNIPADIFARYHRMAGNEVVMVSGSDMHGTPTALKALDEGVEPQVIANRYHTIWSDCLRRMRFSYDLYTHTHTQNHFEVVQDLFMRLYKKGHIYEGTQTLPFSETENIFLTDRLVEGECPFCGWEKARGDQCDSCGRTLDPVDLIKIRSKRDGSTPVFKETNHFFMKLSGFQRELEAWLETRKGWRTNVKNQTLGMLREGLRDRAITRDISWGVPVPIEGYENKRIYVWFEAVSGYLSATVEWAKNIGRIEEWKHFWEDESAETYYFQGKDNVPFHTVIWPAILLGAGGFNLPTDVAANEFLNLGGKFSKSKGNAIWLKDYLSRYKPEPLRYYLASIMPEYSDSEFTWSGFVSANNNELVATYGNFVNRTLTLIMRNFGGSAPIPDRLEAEDEQCLNQCRESLNKCATSLEARRFREAIKHAMRLAQIGNRYIDKKAPWTEVKNNKSSAASTLLTGLTVVATLRTLFYPWLPESSDRLHKMLGFEGAVTDDGWTFKEMKPGARLDRPEPLFDKLDASLVEEENERLIKNLPMKTEHR